MEPKRRRLPPVTIELDAGWYLWCSCGATQKSPFCDATHVKCKPTADATGKKRRPRPKAFKVLNADTAVKICRCGATATPPYCDDSHVDGAASDG